MVRSADRAKHGGHKQQICSPRTKDVEHLAAIMRTDETRLIPHFSTVLYGLMSLHKTPLVPANDQDQRDCVRLGLPREYRIEEVG